MKKETGFLTVLFIICLVIFFVALKAEAQTATVTATIQDPSGQTFNNGTYKVDYVPPSGLNVGPATRKDTGVKLTPAELSINGSLSSGGVMAQSLTRLDYISPTNGSWRFSFCPLSSSTCSQYILTSLAASSLDISTQVNAIIPTIEVSTSSIVLPRAYKEAEITSQVVGSEYWNLTTNAKGTWTGSAWFYGNNNASQLEGKTWEVPGTIGSTTPNTGSFTGLTVGTAGITSIPGYDGGFGPVPLGPDLPIFVQGPADVVNWSKPYSLNSSTAVGSTGVATITVSSTANYFTNLPGSPTALYIEARGATNFEALLAAASGCPGSPGVGLYCIISGTQITANFTKTHSGTYPVWQYGGVLDRTYLKAQDAQDGTHLWFSQQDSSTAPYYFHWALGSGAALFTYSSGGRNWYGDNFLDTVGDKGTLFTATQTVTQTGTGAAYFVRDAASTQYMKMTATQLDFAAIKVTLGGLTSSFCMLKLVAGPVLQIRLADDSGDCTFAAGGGSFTSLLTTGRITSSLATGTSPLAVTSVTVNTNLNADMTDGVHISTPSAGHALCFKDATHISYCTTVVAADGTCTCN